MRKTLLGLAAAAATFVSIQPTLAQSDGPITLLVGYSAGGSADFAARVMAPELSERLGRTVVVENATGASGMIALQKLVNGRADGSTLYYGGFDTVAVPLVNASVAIDWKTETLPVARTATTSMTVAVPAASPYRKLEDLVEAAKAEPDTITYGTPGIGSAQHFVGEMISHAAGVTLLHAPYQGGAQVSNDLLGGMLNSAVFTTSTVLPFVKDGSARALAVTSAERSAALPDVPTLSEVKGFEGLSLPLWQGIFVKPGTDEAFVGKVEAAVTEALAQPDVRERLATAGFAAAPLGSAEFRSFIEEQADAYARIVEQSKISIQ